MKKLFLSIITAMMLLCVALPVLGAPSRLVDDANLLSDSEASEIEALLDKISTEREMDIVIVTTNSLGGKSAMEYADDYFDYNGYGQGSDRSGILLLVSMGSRDWWVSTRGYGITVITDAGLEYMESQFVDYLSDGDYAEGFEKFANLCDDFIRQANTGHHYDSNNLPRDWFSIGRILRALIVSVILTGIIMGYLKRKHKNVALQPSANEYVKEGSVAITSASEHYIYHRVTRTARAKSSSGSSTHRSSSGARHGGGGGRF